jgi:transposase-like protein
MNSSTRKEVISLLEAGDDVATVAEEYGVAEDWVRKVQYREGITARELNNQEKTLDPTIKSTETPDEMVDDTLSIGTNVGSGRYSQR